VGNEATAAQGKKPKLFELDLVRAFAILAVVLIHATSSATVEPAEGSLSQIFFYIVNLSGAFAVPLFIMVSGIVLFYSYDGRWNAKAAGTFYRKRAVSLVIPYLLWALFYYVFYQYLNTRAFAMDWSVFLRMLRWAEWSYHSYFMLIIFQMYVLFPLFMTLTARTSWFRHWLIPLGIAVQAGFYVYGYWFADLSHSDRLAPTYLAYFLIGGAIGLYYLPVKAWLEKNAAVSAAIMLLGGSVYVGLFCLDRYLGITAYLVWYEVSRFVYVIGSALFLMQAGRFLLGRWKRATAWLASIGACSFGIYLVHPSLLSAFTVKWKAPTSIIMYDLYTLLRFVVIFAGSWLLVYLYGKAANVFKRGTGRRVGKTTTGAPRTGISS
jgi:peptidoglycan/LPS O-acetylase OafA/YrhL